MRKYKFQILIILVFIGSLFFTSITVADYNANLKYNGLELLLSGFFAFFGGGFFETIIWLSNPSFLISLILKKNYKIAIIFSTLSLILSSGFLFWKEILVSENGRMGKIIDFGLGYWLWIISILLLNLYHIISIIVEKKREHFIIK